MDLIPRRWWSVLAACVFILASTGSLIAWTWTTQHQSPASLSAAAGLASPVELAGRTTTWFSSLLCVAAAMISLQIYLVRRHRGDDYRGYYTIWLWTAGVCLLASFNVAVGIHRVLLASAWNQVVGKELTTGSWVFDLLILVPLFVLAGRLLWEMGESHAKWGLATSTVLSLGYVLPRFLPDLTQADQVSLAQGTILGVTAGFVVSFLVFARFTLLDAHGLIVRRRERQNAKGERQGTDSTQDEAKRTEKKSRRTARQTPKSDSENEPRPAPTLRAHRPEPEERNEQPLDDKSQNSKKKEPVKTQPSDEAAAAADPEEMIHSLSKAKRKRPSKKQRRQQRRAA